jgi:hypothetical protein
MWSGEDRLADSLVPRFMACGGDRSRLHIVSGIKDGNGGTIPFDPALDMEPLTTRARTIQDLRLLIIDPISSVVAGDSHKNSETRRSSNPWLILPPKPACSSRHHALQQGHSAETLQSG